MMMANLANSKAPTIATAQSVVSIATLLMNILLLHQYLCFDDDFFRAVGQSHAPRLQCFITLQCGYAALQHNEFWGQNFSLGLTITADNTCSFAMCTGKEF